MPARAGRLARAGAHGVCSVLLIVFGTVIVLPGVIIIAFQENVNNDWGIVGMCVLGLGAVCLIIGIWMCSSCFSLCCKKDPGIVIATVEGDRHGQGDRQGRNRRKRRKKSTQHSSSATQGPQVGYLPPNPGTRPTSGGYLPMNPQQGYNLGPSNTPVPQTSVPNYPPTSSVPIYPPNQPYPAVSNPGPLPTYPQHSFYPAPSIAALPPTSGPHYQPAQPYPAITSQGPRAAYPASSTATENLPYNPHFMPVTSTSQQTSFAPPAPIAPPSAPPQDYQNARPPTYDEAMSVNKI